MITRITTLCFAKHVIHCLNKIPNINVQLSPCEKKESSIGTCPKGEKPYFQDMYYKQNS